MKASFFRNVSNRVELLINTTHYLGIVAEYNVIKTIVLDENNYVRFCNAFQERCGFLSPFYDKAVIVNGIWRCVSITNQKEEILAAMNHYLYPRYLAILSNKGYN